MINVSTRLLRLKELDHLIGSLVQRSRWLSTSVPTATSANEQRKGGSWASLVLIGGAGVAGGVAIQQLLQSPSHQNPTDTSASQQPQLQQTQDQSTGASRQNQSASPSGSSASAKPSAPAATATEPSKAAPVHGDVLSQVAASATAERTSAPSSEEPPGPWVVDEEMQMALQRRAVSENRLRAYMRQTEQYILQLAAQAEMMRPAERGKEWFKHQLDSLEPEVDLEAQKILYGVGEPNARQRYLERYGCARWTDACLDLIKSFGPVIEIGAGGGHWQRALAARGTDILAFDNRVAVPLPDKPDVGAVKHGDEKTLAKHRNRTLLLCYPYTDDMAYNTLKQYKGDYILYVGEVRGGVNANAKFFDALEKDWVCEHVEPLDPFPECYEKLFVLRRKGRKPWRGGRGKSWWRLF